MGLCEAQVSALAISRLSTTLKVQLACSELQRDNFSTEAFVSPRSATA